MIFTKTDYVRAHKAITRERGPARQQTCVGCGGPAQEWAYRYTGHGERRYDTNGTPFSTSVEDYQPMCKSCHYKHDTEKDPTLVERHRLRAQKCGDAVRGNVKVLKMRRSCNECGLTSTPGGVGGHQRSTGHTGYKEVAT